MCVKNYIVGDDSLNSVRFFAEFILTIKKNLVFCQSTEYICLVLFEAVYMCIFSPLFLTFKDNAFKRHWYFKLSSYKEKFRFFLFI